MKFKKYIHVTIWTIFFLKGIFQILGLYPDRLNFIALVLIVFLLGLSILNKRIKTPFAYLILLIAIVSIISGPIINKISIIDYFFFFRQLLLLPLLYLIIVINENDDNIIKSIKYTILFFFALQIPAGIIKFFIVGNIESYIGTVSMYEGSMTTMISLFGVSFFFSKYLFFKNKKYLLYLAMFVVFSQIGGKRAVLIYLPLMMLSIYFYYLKMRKINVSFLIKGIFLISILGFSMVYSIVRLNPTLNPEKKVGGSFDINYTIEYVGIYTNSATSIYEYSRPQALVYFINYMFEKPIPVLLFGEGAGKFAKDTTMEVDPIEYFYGIRYGGRVAIVWVFLQIGLIGTLLYIYLFYKMLLFVLNYKPITYHHFVFFGIWIAVILDIFTYSMVSIRFFIINGSLFFYFGLFYRDVKFKKDFLINN